MKTIDRFFLSHSTASGVLWSLGLHAALLGACYAWLPDFVAPLSFAGLRDAVRLEATFSELPTDAPLELELRAPPKIALPFAELPIAPPPQAIFDIPPPAIAPATAIEETLAGIEEETAPDFSGNPPPVYPAEAIRQRQQGIVKLRLHVTLSGDVEHIEIVQSSGHTILDQAAIEAVRTWKGRPAQRAGKPIATVEVLPLRFSLDADG